MYFNFALNLYMILSSADNLYMTLSSAADNLVSCILPMMYVCQFGVNLAIGSEYLPYLDFWFIYPNL